MVLLKASCVQFELTNFTNSLEVFLSYLIKRNKHFLFKKLPAKAELTFYQPADD